MTNIKLPIFSIVWFVHSGTLLLVLWGFLKLDHLYKLQTVKVIFFYSKLFSNMLETIWQNCN